MYDISLFSVLCFWLCEILRALHAYAYFDKIMYQWRFKEPVQFNFVVCNDVLQQNVQINFK